MGYLHIDNLYKNQEIMMFRECFALEKIEGTSVHISMNNGQLTFFAGCVKHADFINLFDTEKLQKDLEEINVTIFGEGYGGKIQGMGKTYGTSLKFVAFDVKIGDSWLSVPKAAQFCRDIGLEFVYYKKIPTEMWAINEQRDKQSEQAILNNMGVGHKREGVVLRPLIELTKNNGQRIIVKHKRDDFKETKTKREVGPEQLKVLSDAQEVADEWVTPMRITHVLDKIENPCMEKMKEIMAAMQEDVEREGEGEIVWSKAVKKAVGRATAVGVKTYFQQKLQILTE